MKSNPSRHESAELSPRILDVEHLSDHLHGAILGNSADMQMLVEQLTPLMTTWANLHLNGSGLRQSDPEDVVQDVWVRILPRLQDIDPHPQNGRISSGLLAVLKKTLLHRTIDIWRAALRENVTTLQSDPQLSTLSSGPLGKSVRSDHMRLVHAALDELSDRDRALYVRRIFEDLSLRELCDEYDMTRDAVIKARQRVRQRLEAVLGKTVLADLEDD